MPIAAALTGASVLVVGATGGLGAPIARRLLDAGANVTGLARDAQRVSAVDPRMASVAGDLMKPDTAERAVESALARWGALDGIVIASGAVAFGNVMETDDRVLIDVFTVNTLAPIRVLRAGLPHLARSERNPFIAVISAVVAETPMPGMAAYSASKAALTAYDAAAARELRRQGIRLLDIRPPHTETGLASRPLAGTSPRLPPGLDPDAVAARIVTAIIDGETDLPSQAFS